MGLTRENRQEDLSFAYISAVAAEAGYNCYSIERHDYGIDLEIGDVEKIGKRRVDAGHRLHIQAKASQNFINSDAYYILYDLEVDAYNMLTLENRGIPAILVLYCMPSDEDDWLTVCEDCTTLRHCGYWLSLRGKPDSANRTTQRIKIPKEQLFTDSSLEIIMSRIKGGGYP